MRVRPPGALRGLSFPVFVSTTGSADGFALDVWLPRTKHDGEAFVALILL